MRQNARAFAGWVAVATMDVVIAAHAVGVTGALWCAAACAARTASTFYRRIPK